MNNVKAAKGEKMLANSVWKIENIFTEIPIGNFRLKFLRNAKQENRKLVNDNLQLKTIQPPCLPTPSENPLCLKKTSSYTIVGYTPSTLIDHHPREKIVRPPPPSGSIIVRICLAAG